MSLSELKVDFGRWADTTFENPPILAYGRKLAQEALEVVKDLEGYDEAKPDDGRARIADELADCLLVICAIANRAGVDLELEARRKFEINKARSWIKQADGTHQHL